jgi:hypothetical protein
LLYNNNIIFLHSSGGTNYNNNYLTIKSNLSLLTTRPIFFSNYKKNTNSFFSKENIITFFNKNNLKPVNQEIILNNINVKILNKKSGNIFIKNLNILYRIGYLNFYNKYATTFLSNSFNENYIGMGVFKTKNNKYYKSVYNCEKLYTKNNNKLGLSSSYLNFYTTYHKLLIYKTYKFYFKYKLIYTYINTNLNSNNKC